MKKLSLLLLLLASMVLQGCATVSNQRDVQEIREEILAMEQASLNQLYRYRPEVRSQIAEAPGYAVFNRANVTVLFASFGGGYGVARDNRNNEHIFMNMGEFGIGPGLGAKDLRSVLVFDKYEDLRAFIDDGWTFGAQADATAVMGDSGGEISGEVVVDDITIYQFTDKGVALQATVKGNRYWQDDELNQRQE